MYHEIKYLSDIELKGLQDMVNFHLKEGWELYGELIIGRTYFYQAVIKENYKA